METTLIVSQKEPYAYFLAAGETLLIDGARVDATLEILRQPGQPLILFVNLPDNITYEIEVHRSEDQEKPYYLLADSIIAKEVIDEYRKLASALIKLELGFDVITV